MMKKAEGGGEKVSSGGGTEGGEKELEKVQVEEGVEDMWKWPQMEDVEE